MSDAFLHPTCLVLYSLIFISSTLVSGCKRDRVRKIYHPPSVYTNSKRETENSPKSKSFSASTRSQKENSLKSVSASTRSQKEDESLKKRVPYPIRAKPVVKPRRDSTESKSGKSKKKSQKRKSGKTQRHEIRKKDATRKKSKMKLQTSPNKHSKLERLTPTRRHLEKSVDKEVDKKRSESQDKPSEYVRRRSSSTKTK